jgi:hypothetical protein
MGMYSLFLAERGVAFSPRRSSQSCAAVFEGERQQILLLVSSNPTSCAQVSKRLVAYIKALLVLSPYGKPSDSLIVASTDAHFNLALASLNILLDVEFKAYMEHKTGEFFQAYGFVATD